MATPTENRPVPDLRDYLAEERTVLAWIRTGLALMGFGFVVARFGLFLNEVQINQGASLYHQHWTSLMFGTALMVLGVVLNLFSAWRAMHPFSEWNHCQFAVRCSPKPAVVLAMCLALVGMALSIYLPVAYVK